VAKRAGKKLPPHMSAANLSTRLFDLMATDYHHWHRMAVLKLSATAVAEAWARRRDEKFQLGRLDLSDLVDEPMVAMLLAGLALENLAKGLVIRREGLDGAALPKGLSSHETRRYLDRAKVELSAAEQKLVSRLEAYVVWAGRYPVPKHRLIDMGGRRMGLPGLEKVLKLYDRIDRLAPQTAGARKPPEGR
jgi:hypothetical protein